MKVGSLFSGTVAQYEGLDLTPEELQDLLMKIGRYCGDRFPADVGEMFDRLRDAMVQLLYPGRRRDWYHTYLKTEWWQYIREKKLESVNRLCALCGQDGFEVHHRTYDHLGHEDLRELLVLCGDCHKSGDCHKIWVHRK